MFLIIKETVNYLKKIVKLLLSNQVLTLGLLIVTYLYLRETASIRKTAEKSLQIETCPKVFISSITSRPRFIASMRQIEITVFVQIKNAGKTEAKNVILNYNLSLGKVQMKDKIGPIPHIFPDQSLTYSTKVMSLNLDKKNLLVVKEALREKKSISIKGELQNPIILEMNLKYPNKEGVDENISYKFKYLIRNNAWVYLPND